MASHELPLTLDQLRQELNLRRRTDRLDSALLFLTSSISLAFAFIQILLGGIPTLILLTPAIILGWLIPFYIGYVHGAIKKNSVTDRIRGWNYLTFGIVYYVISLSISLFLRGYEMPIQLLEEPIVFIPHLIIFGVTIFLAIFILASQPSWISGICATHQTLGEGYVNIITRASAFSLAYGCYHFSIFLSIIIVVGIL